jgi:hypothetical protein
MILQPKVDKGEQEGTAIKELLKDPYILVAAGKKKIQILFDVPRQCFLFLFKVSQNVYFLMFTF